MQSSNAFEPIYVRLSGNYIYLNSMHPEND